MDDERITAILTQMQQACEELQALQGSPKTAEYYARLRAIYTRVEAQTAIIEE